MTKRRQTTFISNLPVDRWGCVSVTLIKTDGEVLANDITEKYSSANHWGVAKEARVFLLCHLVELLPPLTPLYDWLMDISLWYPWSARADLGLVVLSNCTLSLREFFTGVPCVHKYLHVFRGDVTSRTYLLEWENCWPTTRNVSVQSGRDSP